MAEEEVLDDGAAESGGAAAAASTSKLTKILVYVIVGLIAIVGSITISVLTYNTMSKGLMPVPDTVANEGYGETIVKELQYFDQIPGLRLRTNDEATNTLVVSLQLGHDVNNALLATELIRKQSPLTDVIRNFFMSKSQIELSIEREALMKDELMNKINSELINGEIERVIFTEFQIISTQ